MSGAQDQTRRRIALAALTLFMEKGIRVTRVEQVAGAAGVTRITVYRYFPNKRALVRGSFLGVEKIFQDGLAELVRDPHADWRKVFARIGERLGTLPPGDAAARFDELRRVYPSIYASVQKVRSATLDGLFARFFDAAKQQGLLRPTARRPFVRAIFWELAIGFFENPRLHPVGFSDAELYRSMSDFLLYGAIGREPRAKSRRPGARR